MPVPAVPLRCSLSLVVALSLPAAAQVYTGVTAPEPEAFAQYGRAVAVDGERVVVSAPFTDGVAFNEGRAWILAPAGVGWEVEAELVDPSPALNDEFGVSLDLDGDLVAVGSLDTNGGSQEFVGAVHLFRNRRSGWMHEAELTDQPPEELARFGTSLSLDGDLVAVGAPFADATEFASGEVHVFRRDGPRWVSESVIVPDDSFEEQHFGMAVALDAGHLAVGAPWDDDVAFQAGAVYVYRREGTAWLLDAKLQSPDLEANDEFGAAVALEGRRLAVASPFSDDPWISSGAVYMFERTALGWTFRQKINAPDTQVGDVFGQSVALSGDRLLVGAADPNGPPLYRGAAHLLRLVNGGWRHQTKLTPPPLGAAAFFGYDVALDGRVLASGAYLDEALAPAAGSAWIIEVPEPPGPAEAVQLVVDRLVAGS